MSSYYDIKLTEPDTENPLGMLELKLPSWHFLRRSEVQYTGEKTVLLFAGQVEVVAQQTVYKYQPVWVLCVLIRHPGHQDGLTVEYLEAVQALLGKFPYEAIYTEGEAVSKLRIFMTPADWGTIVKQLRADLKQARPPSG